MTSWSFIQGKGERSRKTDTPKIIPKHCEVLESIMLQIPQYVISFKSTYPSVPAKENSL